MITIITGAICLFLGAAAGIMLMAWVVAHRLGPRDLDSYGGTDDE